ncbi:VOC family protein [Limisalsivibrio acetivorans]|uniref:VOC family protein n=1 Tax=Limisalsivibrio acetivorans TaxID=1304888 RepID=UPI0003B32C84|nr:VOC family protein [Limisalsivibrio acetivorans]
MDFRMVHTNINVLDLDKSVKFFEEALGLKEARRFEQPEGKFILVYLEDGKSDCQIELTWLRDRNEPYNHGDNDLHIAFVVDDFEAAHKKHKDMDCIVFENMEMGIYFIKDPNGYWLEIIPADK